MPTKLTLGTGGPPVGHYMTTFVGVDETDHEKWGKGLRWKFEILAGPLKGQNAARITGTAPTAKNAAGKMLANLAGRALAPAETVEINQFVGQAYLVIVEETESGATRVQTAIKQGINQMGQAPAASPAAASAPAQTAAARLKAAQAEVDRLLAEEEEANGQLSEAAGEPAVN